MGSNIKKWETQNKGIYNAVKITNKQNSTAFQFEYDASTRKGVETQFCELGELTQKTKIQNKRSEKMEITDEFAHTNSQMCV